MLADERGSATVLVVAGIGVLVAVLVGALTVLDAVATSRRAQAAADLGALAAATAARSGADGCVVGAETARANGGELTTCVDEGGGVFRATVTVPFTPIVPADVGPASAVARAGPTG
ncbi:Rv3654c family TadE-like protein [Janibacter massiliensis]|uniref:Rv3654c family TadE-like protein n=1 Tax=Janibacter massiliensis TaxID=2058291 RepID=UPI000D111D77|nr:Rv3654c family TadE-like protein [Janibacter massiliensis]